jgi:TolB protein
MSLSGPLHWVIAALALLPASAFAAESKTPVTVEEFLGGTGGAASKLVRQALDRSGRLEPASGGATNWLVRASSSAGRIDGALVSAEGKVIFNNHYDWPELRDNAHAFADDLVEAVTGATGIAMSRIAFVSDRSGHKEIYVCDSDGQRVQQITRDRSVNVSPSLGPGGLLLVNTSYAGGFPDIYVTNLRDGDRQRLISAPGTNSGAAFSHDGTRLALTMTHSGDPEIHVTPVTGGRSRRVTESRSVEFSPAWSPDGERLVFCSDATGSPQLYVCPRQGGAPERLATGIASCTDPDWNADGRLIAFTARQGGGRSVAVYELESGRTRIVLTGAADPAWAPDGRHLAAVQAGELVVLNVATGKKEKIVTGMGRVSEPAWSK